MPSSRLREHPAPSHPARDAGNDPARVPDGAVLKIRAGTYAGFTIASKSLTLLGEPGAVVGFSFSPGVAIHSLPANQSVVLRGLSFGPSIGIVSIDCDNNLGRVLFEDCHPAFSAGVAIRALRCAQLHIVDCSFDSTSIPLVLDSCSTTLVRSVQITRPFVPGIDLRGGRLDLVASTVSTEAFGGPGIQLSASAALLIRASSTVAGGLLTGSAAISGTGRVVVDPSTNLVSRTLPIAAGVNATFTPLAELDASTQPPGGIAQATLTRAPGSTEIAALFVGLPGAPITVVPFPEPIWLEHATNPVHYVH